MSDVIVNRIREPRSIIVVSFMSSWTNFTNTSQRLYIYFNINNNLFDITLRAFIYSIN